VPTRRDKEDAVKDRVRRSREGLGGRHHQVLLVAAALTYLLVTAGAAVCATGGSRAGCPDWPRCHGGLLPPLRMEPIIEYTHRFLAALTFAIVVIAAAVGWRRFPDDPWIRIPPGLASGLFVAVSIFGALAVLRGLSAPAAAVDVGFALLALGLVTVATVAAWHRRLHPDLSRTVSFRGTLPKLALATLAGMFAVLVGGVLVAAPDSFVRCLGWPLLRGDGAFAHVGGWAGSARYAIAAGTAVLLVALVVEGWRRGGAGRAVRRSAAAVGLLFLLELIAGLLLPVLGFPVLLRMGYVALAAALWVALVALTMLSALRAPAALRATAPAP
jgi:heme a synthase